MLYIQQFFLMFNWKIKCKSFVRIDNDMKLDYFWERSIWAIFILFYGIDETKMQKNKNEDLVSWVRSETWSFNFAEPQKTIISKQQQTTVYLSHIHEKLLPQYQRNSWIGVN